MTDKILTQARLKELLNYNPETGVFTWRVSLSRSIHIGDDAGSNHSRGYRSIIIDGKYYLAHRLAWLWVYGEWCDSVDHINGKRNDNRLDNLRAVTNKQNQENQALRANNKSGYRGVHWHKSSGKWRAQITNFGKIIGLGYFNTPEEAGRAAKAARDMLFTHHKTEYAA